MAGSQGIGLMLKKRCRLGVHLEAEISGLMLLDVASRSVPLSAE